MSRSERIALGSLAVLSLIMRGVAFFHYRFDSDEPQHLHVAWGWTAGLVQYRDLFDNHAPLFHILSAPLLTVLGERPDILLYMRAPMLALWAMVLGATFVIGRRLYSQRIALWSVLLLVVLPPFFLKSIEYRTDNLWNALWFLALVLLTLHELTAVRMFFIGLILGVAFCVSLKTTLLVITLLLAAIITSAMTMKGRPVLSQIGILIPALPGLVIAPCCLAMWFVRAGVWKQALYCVLEFNELIIRTRDDVWIYRTIFPFAMLLVLYSSWVRHRRVVDEVSRWRFFFGTAAAIFSITLGGFWILISPRDFLPILPFFAIFIVAALDRARYDTPLLTAAVVFCMVLTFHYADNLRDGTAEHITMMKQVLGLTRPGEPLMDLKGETIYRRRPFYYIFEFITRAEMQHGLIADTMAQSVIAARCHVAQADGGFFPPEGREFLRANFLDVGRLRVSGQWIGRNGTFEIAVPGSYMMLGHDMAAGGVLDGTPYGGARMLEAGRHHFQRQSPGQRVAAFWAPAYARGYSPFHPRDRDF